MTGASKLREDGRRRATNISLGETLVVEAQELGINISRACEAGLKDEVRRERLRRWQDENAGAFGAWDDFVERNGVPLAKYRKF